MYGGSAISMASTFETPTGWQGVVRVHAEGTRNLFNEGDMLFVDYDRDGKMGGGEQLAIDGHRAVGVPLSIDAAESDSFDRNGLGIFEVYYVPGGKEPFNHASEIRLTASVDYSDPSAIDEKDAKATTTFNFDGVESEVLAYAIPFDGNGKGDQANIRVRCENTAGCRVFVECTDDDAMRGFGEAETLVYEQLTTWSVESPRRDHRRGETPPRGTPAGFCQRARCACSIWFGMARP